MSQLTSGTYKIVSLTEGNPTTGIGLIIPAFQAIHLDQTIQDWKLKQVQVGDQIFRFGIGGYSYTGVLGDNVIATVYTEQDVKWRITYRAAQDAYTIQPNDQQYKTWTVSVLDVPNVDIKAAIEVKQFVYPDLSRFDDTQLFRFDRIDRVDE